MFSCFPRFPFVFPEMAFADLVSTREDIAVAYDYVRIGIVHLVARDYDILCF